MMDQPEHFSLKHTSRGPVSRTGFLIALSFCLTLVAVAFWAGLQGGFIFDDYPNLVSQESVQLEKLDGDDLLTAAFAFQHGGLPRPVANVTFALNHLAHGLDPRGYKLTNLALHILNAALIAVLTLRIVSLSGLSANTARLSTLFISTVWALHPLQVSTVLYVVQRMEVMCTTFTILALLAYLHARWRQIHEGKGATPYFLAALLATALAVGSKETGLLIPAYCLALEIILLRCRAKNITTERLLRVGAKFGLFALVVTWILANAYLIIRQPGFELRDFNALERMLAQLEIIPFYLWLILVPRIDSMHFFYDNLIAPSSLTMAAAIGALLIIFLAVSMVALRKRQPLISLGIAVYLASHLITSSALSLELAFEHRNYFAIFGVALALSATLGNALQKTNLRLYATISVAILCTLALLTAIRSSYWSSPPKLATYLAEINPDSPRAAMDLGEQYMLASQGDRESPLFQAALNEYTRAANLPPHSIMGEHGLIMMAAKFGLTGDPAWWASMQAKLSTPPIRPQEIAALVGMVEHRMNGLRLDDGQLAKSTVLAASNQNLAPELLFLFANQALLSDDNGSMARELFARGLYSADPEYAARAREGIEKVAGREFLVTVEKRVESLSAEL